MKRFINQSVTIMKDGAKGIVEAISEEDGYITVKSGEKERGFTPLAVVEGKLVFDNEEIQSVAIPLFADLKERLEELQNEKDEKAIKEKENEYICRIRRKIGDSNVAFKCTYCDGSASAKCMGFRGPCSELVRKHNVKKRSWCKRDICRCKKLFVGDMTQEEFDSKADASERKELLCYESRMFKDWVCYAGMEEKTGKPMALNKAQIGSLAVMTTRPIVNGKEVSQKDTIIFGVFLIAKYDDLSEIGGSVTAHPVYRLELTPEEAKEMLLWKYHANLNNKDEAFWGSGLHRYLSDMECCQILLDIVKCIKDPTRKALAKEMLDKFQKETGITTILPPDGAI